MREEEENWVCAPKTLSALVALLCLVFVILTLPCKSRSRMCTENFIRAMRHHRTSLICCSGCGAGRETLIVVSSDLSHYHDYETERRLDVATAAAIEHANWASLGLNQARGYLAQEPARTHCCVSGWGIPPPQHH
jgi:hypothetical protein